MSKSSGVTKSVVFIRLYITVVSKETISRLLVQMDMIHRSRGIILIIFLTCFWIYLQYILKCLLKENPAFAVTSC